MPAGVRIHRQGRTGLLRKPGDNGGQGNTSGTQKHHTQILLNAAPEIQGDDEWSTVDGLQNQSSVLVSRCLSDEVRS